MAEILDVLFTNLFLLILLALVIALLWFYFSLVDKDTKLKNDYIASLDEHDKSVLMTYLNTKYHPFDRKGKSK